MVSSSNDSAKVEFPEELSGLFHKYHDRVLADDSLSDQDVILVCLHLIEGKNNKVGVSYDECKQLFMFLGRKEDNYRANLHNAKKNSSIEQRDTALSLTIHGLKRVQKLLGRVEKSPVYVIKSGHNFTAIKLLEEFLHEAVQSGEILLCDPHVSAATLFPFSNLKDKLKSIKILTTNVHDGDRFAKYKSEFTKETGIAVEVKVTTKIHDRYLISADKCWSFGASIKDLGNKDTTIKEISEVIASIKDLFEERWRESAPHMLTP